MKISKHLQWSLFVAALTILALKITIATNPQPTQQVVSAATSKKSIIELTNPDYFKNLPVANIKNSRVNKAWGTVIYMPQIHQMPGSNPNDNQNNKAEITQNQSYQILQNIIRDFPLKLVLIEGENKGDISLQKKDSLAQKIKIRNQLVTNLDFIQKNPPKNPVAVELQKKVLHEGKMIIAQIDREIILKGAPLKLWAEGADITLAGTENPQTIEISKKLVRDFYYLQDRLQEINKPKQLGYKSNIILKLGTALNQVNLDDFSPQLMDSNQDNFITNFYKNLKELLLHNQTASESKKSNENIQNLASSLGALLNLKRQEDQQNNAHDAPSRSDNPFSYINDPQQITALIMENQDKINNTIIDKRNQETAENVVASLKAHNQDIALLQFGAGHEIGLIKALNQAGLNVISIVPKEALSVTDR